MSEIRVCIFSTQVVNMGFSLQVLVAQLKTWEALLKFVSLRSLKSFEMEVSVELRLCVVCFVHAPVAPFTNMV